MMGLFVGALAGAWLVGRGKPRAKVIRREAIGSVSGAAYYVEEFPEAGLLLLTVERRGRATLERRPSGGFIIRKAAGTPTFLAALRKDFEVKHEPAETSSRPE